MKKRKFLKRVKIFIAYTLCVTSVTMLVLWVMIQAVLQYSYRQYPVTQEEIMEVKK